jgi:MSHA biogenesis protein MshJ
MMSYFTIKEIAVKFNQASLRERGLMFVAVVTCFISMTYFWIIDPVMFAALDDKKQLQSIEVEQLVYMSKIAQIEERLQGDALKQIDDEITALKLKLAELDARLSEPSVHLVDAAQMPLVLYKVLASKPNVKINYLKTLPIESIKVDTKQENQGNVSLYKHLLEVQISGKYNDLYEYLRELESLKTRFYWHALWYEIDNYPTANVTLQIYTLSRDQSLIGGE